MIHDVLETPAVMSSLYSVLFNLLDMMSLRTNLCHLLAKITQRKHVKPFRIKMLRQLSEGVTREANLVKLMEIYDEYVPGILDVPRTNGPVVFAHPDPEWAERLRRIQEVAGFGQNASPVSSKPFRFAGRGSKTQAASSLEDDAIRIQDLKTIGDLINRLEKVEIPQMDILELDDSLFRRYMALQPDGVTAKQLDDLLTPLLEQELEGLSSGRRVNREVLEVLLTYVKYTKVRFPSYTVHA